jgi:hypothetical protein
MCKEDKADDVVVTSMHRLEPVSMNTVDTPDSTFTGTGCDQKRLLLLSEIQIDVQQVDSQPLNALCALHGYSRALPF